MALDSFMCVDEMTKLKMFVVWTEDGWLLC